MQDLNNENTIPTQPNQGSEETLPTQAQYSPPVDSSPYPGGEPVAQSPAAVKTKSKKPRGPRRWPWVLLGILMVFLFAGAGGWIGYQSALKLRKDKQTEQVVSVAKEHFMLGLVAHSNKQYEIARQQYEYVIRLDPNFPGVQDKLREVLIEMSMDRTPTPAPTVVTPTLTPTVDTRPQEEIFNQARQQYAAQDWAGLFASVDSLRRVDPNYRAVEIDGMMYVALRFRGIDKILHQANLEGGLYDLALAERFGPLDVDSLGYRNWARMYLNGASFWEVDWPKVMAYFEEIYPYFPNMRDSSGMTAIERYRIAAKSEGDRLAAAGDACGAYDYYKKSLDAVNDPAVEQKAQEVYLICYPPTPTETPTVPVTPTPTVGATAEVPTQQPPTAAPPTEAPPTEAPPTEEPPAEPPTEEPPAGGETPNPGTGGASRLVVTPTPKPKR